MKTLEELQDIFRNFVLTSLNITENPNKPFVRFVWPEEQQPAFSNKEEYCFIQITISQNEIERYKEKIYSSSGTETLAFTRVINVRFIFYGTECIENATNLEAKFYSQNALDFLNNLKMALITGVHPLTFLPELHNTQWFRRCDLELEFNDVVETTEEIGSVEGTEINVITSN